VDGTDPATGFFRYAEITPVALNTTDTYAVVGVSGSDFYTVGVPKATSPVNPAINYLSGAGWDGGYTSVLEEPNDFSAGNIFGTPTPETDLTDFGANFQFTAAGGTGPGGPGGPGSSVPEPGTLALLSAGLLGLAGMGRRKTS
jgi:hypothetical protein